MDHHNPDRHQNSVSRFWLNYLSILENSSIPVKIRHWYRKHIEEYISAHQGVKLKHHTPDHVSQYLLAKGRTSNLPEWRFRQIADALRLLFKELIGPEWATEYDWYQWRAFAKELEPDHPSLMRDGNPSLITSTSKNTLIRKFREEHAPYTWISLRLLESGTWLLLLRELTSNGWFVSFNTITGTISLISS